MGGSQLRTVFMLHNSGGSKDRPGPFLAPIVRLSDNLNETLLAFLAGLTPSEIDLGIITAVPEGTRLNEVKSSMVSPPSTSRLSLKTAATPSQ